MRRVNHAIMFRVLNSACLAALLICEAAARADDEIAASLDLPDGRSSEETPQMVLVTFDDYIDDEFGPLVLSVFDGRSNTNGSPIQATFFVMTDESDFWQIHNIHSRGHEIGVHSMTHSTGTNTTEIVWRRELEGCRETISKLASIPIEDIRGSRAPYLAYNPEYFESLHRQGFLYDASVTDFPNASGSISTNQGNVVWPYTLHDGFHQPVWGGEAPTNDLPGLFEVPMWTMGESLKYADVMDPDGDHDEILALFKDHLDQRHAGNRAPLGIWLHAKWLRVEDHISALEDFLDYALGLDDVWVVSMGDAVDFMRDLPSLEELDGYPPFNPTVETPIPRASGAEYVAIDAPPDVYQQGLQSALGFVPDQAPPRFAAFRKGAAGLRAEWNRSGVGYRLLKSVSPLGPWDVILETTDTATEWSLPFDSQKYFYRIEAIR